MNRTYIPENSRENNAERLPRIAAVLELILRFFDLVLDFFSEESVRKTVRVFAVIVCFFAFLFVIGAVETAAIGLGAGILASALLFSIAFFCVYRPMKHRD
jgi:uncharacterized membrane protein